MISFSPAAAKSPCTGFSGDSLNNVEECSQWPAKITLPPYCKLSNADANRRCNVKAEQIQVGRATAPTREE